MYSTLNLQNSSNPMFEIQIIQILFAGYSNISSLYIVQVCDKPLAVMDARTFNKENEVPRKTHINFMPIYAVMFHNLGGSIIFDTMQSLV